MACICDICKDETEDSYNGRINHITQFHPLNLMAQMAAEFAAPVGNAIVQTVADLFKPLKRRSKRRDTKRRKRHFR